MLKKVVLSKRYWLLARFGRGGEKLICSTLNRAQYNSGQKFMLAWLFAKRREVAEEISDRREHAALAVRPGYSEQPLSVVLNGQVPLRRIRSNTRLAASPPACAGSRLSIDSDISIDAQLALGVGIMASELGVRTIKARAPRGYNSIESLRLLRASSLRFDLSLVYEVESEEEGLEIAHWCDALELAVVKTPSNYFLKRLDELQVGLSLCRASQMTNISEILHSLRRVFSGEVCVVERAPFDYSAVVRICSNTPVVVTLSSQTEEAIALSAIGAGAAGVELSLGQCDELYLSARFNSYHSLLRKVAALQATLRAIRHI